MLFQLSEDLLKVVTSFLPNPDILLSCCRAGGDLSGSPHALCLWLINKYGKNGAIIAFTKCPCAKHWSMHKVRRVIQLALELGAQLPPGLALAALHWTAVTLGDGESLQMLITSLEETGVHNEPGCLDAKILGGQLLTDASAKGCEASVRVLLAAGAAPRDGLALKAAAENGHAGVVLALLSSGKVDPRADNDVCLRMAAKLGHTNVMLLLLHAGCCPHAKQDEALCLSVGGSHAEAARLLLKAGADPSSRAGLLQLAVCAEQDDVLVGMLIEAGARDEDGMALCTAAASGRKSVVRMLLQNHQCHAHVQEGLARVRNPLTVALQHALVNGQMDIAVELLQARAPIDSALLSSRRRFADERQALALLEGFPGNVRCSQDLDEELTQAASDPDDALMRLLLRWGANPTGWECQALRKAVLHGRVECVRTIIGAAGVAGLKHEMPCCVMRAAVQRGHLQVASELLSAGLWPSPSARHCCADPHTCAARMLCAANSIAMAGLLMRFGAAAHAGDALRLVACGKAPSWRSEEVVQMVMDAMVGLRMESHLQQQQQELQSGQERHSACCHEHEEDSEHEQGVGSAAAVRLDADTEAAVGKAACQGGSVTMDRGLPLSDCLGVRNLQQKKAKDRHRMLVRSPSVSSLCFMWEGQHDS